jgi:signal peptidase II
MAPRLTGLVVAILVVLADQASKSWIFELVSRHEPPFIPITSFFNLVKVWNTGVSFGLFQDETSLRSLILIGVAVVVMFWLAIWLWRSRSSLAAVALGGILGGALGNILDRWQHGAVYDFLDFHVAGWHWPAFNLADSAIVVGVALLLLDGYWPRRSGQGSGG